MELRGKGPSNNKEDGQAFESWRTAAELHECVQKRSVANHSANDSGS